MTNQQMESIYSSFLGMGHAAALKALYTVGYANGAGIAIDANLIDEAAKATVLTPAQVTAVVTSPKLKKPD